MPYWKSKLEKLGCLFKFKCESRTCASHDTAHLIDSARLTFEICDAHHSSNKLPGSSQSKQLRIKLLYRYKQAKTSKITVLNIRKLYLYFVYFKLYANYFEWSLPVSLKEWCARNTWKVAYWLLYLLLGDVLPRPPLYGDQKVAGSIPVWGSETFFWVFWVANSLALNYQAASHFIYTFIMVQS